MKKHIPNTITCLNLISGCIATYWAFQGDYELALLFIVIGAVFDFFDGMVARLLHVSSPIGKELDSLADDITFGCFLSLAIGKIQPRRASSFRFYRSANPCQRLVLGSTHRRIGRSDIDSAQCRIYYLSRYLCQQLVACGRNSHVCTEIQDLGLEGQRDKVYFPAYLYSSFTPAWNQRTGSYHCMVCHPICS